MYKDQKVTLNVDSAITDADKWDLLSPKEYEKEVVAYDGKEAKIYAVTYDAIDWDNSFFHIKFDDGHIIEDVPGLLLKKEDLTL